jgi:hypothetical protein
MTEHAARSKSKKIHALLRELSNDEDNLVNVELNRSMSLATLNAHGSTTTAHTWISLSRYQMAGLLFSGGG